MNIPPTLNFINMIIDGLKVNPLLTAGLMILAILVVSMVIQGLGRQK